ncbi:MAG TPA: ATP-binding protein, partial [Flavipsychrobacter sp.]
EGSTISVTTNVAQNEFVLSVKDEGVGISEEDQQHLFQRFFRGANVTNIQGTGLGLHIVSKYAELMNGDITYETALNKGTKFIITFKNNHTI